MPANLNRPAIGIGPLTRGDFDQAVSDHMAHGAMSGADPLTDSLLYQMDACASEGSQHRDPAPSGTHRYSLLSRAWLCLVRALG